MPPPSMPLLATTGGTKPPGKGDTWPEIPLVDDSLALVNESQQNSVALFKGETSLQRYFDQHPDVVGVHSMVKTRRTTRNFLRFAYAAAVPVTGLLIYVGQPLLAALMLIPIFITVPLVRSNPHPLEQETTRFGVIEELIAQKRLPDAVELMRDLSVDQLFQEAKGSISMIRVLGRELSLPSSRDNRIAAQRQLYMLASHWGNWRAVYALNWLEESGLLLKPEYSLSAVEESPRLIEYALSGDERAEAAAELLDSKSPAFETAYRTALREKEGRDPSRR